MRLQGLHTRILLLLLAIPPALLIAGCFPASSDADPKPSNGRSEKRTLPGTGGATSAGDGAVPADNPDAGGPEVAGAAGAGGSEVSGTSGAGGSVVSGTSGAGGAVVSGFAGAGGSVGAGGATGGVDSPPALGGHTGGLPGAGGAAGAPVAGAGGAAGSTPVCRVHCVQDPPYCRCGVSVEECAQQFEVSCPDGVAGACTCRLNGDITATLPAGNACDPSLLTAASGCDFALVISN